MPVLDGPQLARRCARSIIRKIKVSGEGCEAFELLLQALRFGKRNLLSRFTFCTCRLPGRQCMFTMATMVARALEML